MNFIIKRPQHIYWLPIGLFLFLLILFVATKYFLDARDTDRRLALATVVSEQVVNGLEVFSADRKRAIKDLTLSWPDRHPNPTDWFHTHAASMKNVLPGIQDVWWVSVDYMIKWSIVAKDRDDLLGQSLLAFNLDLDELNKTSVTSSFQDLGNPVSYYAQRIDNNNPGKGYVVASFDLFSTIQVLIGELVGPQFQIILRDGDNVLIEHGDLRQDRSAVHQDISFAGRTWQFTIQSARTDISLGTVVFAVGSLMSCFVCLFLFRQLRSALNLSKSQTLYKAAGEASLDSIFVYEAVTNQDDQLEDFKLVDANKVASNNFRINTQEQENLLLSHQLLVLNKKHHFDAFLGVAITGKPFEFQWHNETNLSSAKWLKTQVVQAGSGIAVTIRDITQRYENQVRLQQSEARFRRLVDGLSQHFIYSISDAGELSYISSGIQDILGYSPEEFMQNYRQYALEVPQSFNDIRMMQKLGQSTEPYQIKYADTEGVQKVISFSDSPVFDDKGELLAIEGIGRDVTAEVEMQERVNFQANHDQLTQLYNRYAFDRILQETIENIMLDGACATLCYIDMDKFKLVNDTCGHQAGDQLLRSIANILSQQLGENDILARVGGDEFCMILRDVRVEPALKTIESILESVAAFRFTWDEKVFHVGASIGVVGMTENRATAVDLIKDADNACYAAKRNGRNQYYIHNEKDEDLAKSKTELEWLSQIQTALESNMFELFYQTIKNLEDDSPALRYEILLRMKGADGNLVSPGIFIPIAERYGLMPRLDQWVFEQTLQLLESHPEHVEKLEKCAINLSGASLSSPTLLSSILTRLQTTVIPKHKICFEITETSAVTNLVNASNVIQEIRQLGCKFALDDFGAGMSSFTYLKNMQVDYVKIDGAFVKDITSDKSDFATVKAIHEIAISMGKQTIAEFVGSDEAVTLLQKIGVNYAQGFHISKPENFMALLSSR